MCGLCFQQFVSRAAFARSRRHAAVLCMVHHEMLGLVLGLVKDFISERPVMSTQAVVASGLWDLLPGGRPTSPYGEYTPRSMQGAPCAVTAGPLRLCSMLQAALRRT